jgi:Rap guanine nucleotide exchange factor 4
LVFYSFCNLVFSQGDEGKSWYIILKGSVQCIIYGKGIVGTLHEGDDFGKLSLVNNSPRTATIVLNEDNTHFLRVDKDDFNRVLRDVEANTIKLKEFGKDVLILDKVPINVKTSDGTYAVCYKYSVMSGTAEKMLEYILETYIGVNCEEGDTTLDDFLSTYVVFMPINQMCATLLSIYKAKLQQRVGENMDLTSQQKIKVIRFILEWHDSSKETFFEDPKINSFLEV